MKTKFFTLILALAASVGTMFADSVKIGDLYYNLNKTDKTAEVCYNDVGGCVISVVDNSLADWETLPKELVASAKCSKDATFLALNSVKVFADPKYINILIEPIMYELPDREWVPFHVFIDTDNSDATGGYSDLFTDANTDVMLEGALFAEGNPYNYNPAVFKWWGAVGGSGWQWTDPSVTHDASDNWGAIIGEGQLPVGASQYVDGKFEIQIDRTCIPATWNTSEFGIGFDIQQNWSSVGVLPCAEYTDENPNGKAAKMKVKIDHASAQPSDSHAISGNVVIPASVSYEGITYSVTSIGESAFEGCSSLTSVTIPNSVTSIGKKAFDGCSGLTSVILNSNAIVSQGYGWDSSIANIFGSQVKEYIIGESVTSIGQSAFHNCSGLTSVTIGNSVTSIGNYAFYGCSSLTSVTIPNSVTSIGGAAFYGCNSLTSPVYNAHVFAFMPSSYSGAYTILEGIEAIAGGAFYNCSSLTSVTIPNSVTSIGDGAFYDCSSLASIEIPNSVTSIGEGAFAGCSSLTSVMIPNSVTSIGYEAFMGCSSLASIEIPNSVTSIGEGAFASCSSLTSVMIPNSVTSIGYSAFVDCTSLTSVTIPNSVTSIGWGAFYGCSGLTSVMIGNSVTSIGERTFDGCNNLETVSLGNSLETIAEYAFNGCERIIDIYCYAERVPTVQSSTFDGVSRKAYLWVPANRLRNYETHEIWGEFLVQPMAAEDVNTNTVTVVPDYNTAKIIWTVVENADSYNITITDKDGKTVCTLVFDSNGLLQSIAFGAPSRNNAPEQTQSTGFRFEVSGLEEGTTYDYTIVAKDVASQTLQTFNGSFKTLGGTDAVADINLNAASHKIFRNGEVLILRDGKTYTIQGVEVR